MKTTGKIISLCLSLFMLISCICVPVSAAQPEEIMPCYNNISETASSFSIDSSGMGTVTAGYRGYSGVTESVTITIKIQKRTLGFVWTKVDIGVPNNEIEIVSAQPVGDYSYNIRLNSTGNYRAVITYTVSGSGGANDVIEDICTAEYH